MNGEWPHSASANATCNVWAGQTVLYNSLQQWGTSLTFNASNEKHALVMRRATEIEMWENKK